MFLLRIFPQPFVWAQFTVCAFAQKTFWNPILNLEMWPPTFKVISSKPSKKLDQNGDYNSVSAGKQLVCLSGGNFACNFLWKTAFFGPEDGVNQVVTIINFRYEWIFENIYIQKMIRTNIEIYLYHKNDRNEYPNIFISKNDRNKYLYQKLFEFKEYILIKFLM